MIFTITMLCISTTGPCSAQKWTEAPQEYPDPRNLRGRVPISPAPARRHEMDMLSRSQHTAGVAAERRDITALKANIENRPSIERIREVLNYDPVSGILTWKITSGRAYAGKEAGGIDRWTGYHRVRVDGIPILSHHVAFAIVEGVWPERVDHRLGKEAGNHWGNLRLCTQSQNMGNIGLPKDNTSGIKGVSFHGVTGKWCAQISIHGKRTWLGAFETKEEAGRAYAVAAAVHFGLEFARVEEFPTHPPLPPRQTIRHPRRAPTVEELRSMFSYDPETGILRWGAGGPIAGQETADGYIRVGIFGKHYYAHVLIWTMITGIWPTLVIHHRDAFRDNNRWKNLEETTQSENVKAGYVHMRAGTAPLYRRRKIA